MATIYTNPLADIDPRLLSEAFRRAREIAENSALDTDALLSAIFAAARRGTRDMHGLVRAAQANRINEAA